MDSNTVRTERVTVNQKFIKLAKVGTVLGIKSTLAYCVAVKCDTDLWTVTGLDKPQTDQWMMDVSKTAHAAQSWYYVGLYVNQE